MAWLDLHTEVTAAFTPEDIEFDLAFILERRGEFRAEKSNEITTLWRLRNKPRIDTYEKARAQDPARKASKAAWRRANRESVNARRKAKYAAQKAGSSR